MDLPTDTDMLHDVDQVARWAWHHAEIGCLARAVVNFPTQRIALRSFLALFEELWAFTSRLNLLILLAHLMVEQAQLCMD